MKNHQELLFYCVDILERYIESHLSPEDHLNEYLNAQEFADVDATFISEVFSGVLRYQSISQVVTGAFYSTEGKNIPVADSTLLNVLCYIALFRLDEIGVPHFKRFVRSQDFNKMYKFLKFLTKEMSLKTWMKDEWSKLYDMAFVETTLLSPILRLLPELEELVQELKKKVDGQGVAPKTKLASTKVKEFNLTKPRPRSVPLPDPIPKLQKHSQVPSTNYSAPKEFAELQEKRIENRRKAEGRLMESSKKSYSCANPTKSQKTIKKLERIRLEEDQKLQFEKHKAKPLPTEIMNSDVPIKLNAATILREGLLFKKREEDVIKRLEQLEAGAHDASKFLKWQEEMRQKDLDEELAAVERHRLEGKLSHEEAILARQQLIADNHRKVLEMKEETKDMMSRYLEERLEEEQFMKSLVEMVMGGRENAKEAKKKLIASKAKIVKEVNEESKELMRQALEEAEEEMRKKIELIHQIRAMEAAPISRNKLVDFTETAGYRLLSEMSLAELKERLSLLREQREAEEEQKRDEILAERQAKDAKLLDTLTVISRHRAEDTRVKAEQRAHAKAQNGMKKSNLAEKDEKLALLQEKLEQKKAERRELQEKSKIKASPGSLKRTRFLYNEKNKSEERRWAELEKSKKRMANLKAEGTFLPTSDSRITTADRSRLAINSQPFIVT